VAAKPDVLVLQVSKRVADLHQAKQPKHPASVLVLRGVAKRALDAWKVAPFPGADPKPWIEARLAKYVAALDGTGDTEDADLLPVTHPKCSLTKRDPWEELLGAEERIAALQKQLVTSVTRADVRKQATEDLTLLNRRIAHLFKLNFEDNAAEQSVTGILRKQVVSAAALVHEELERRKVVVKTDLASALYGEAYKERSEPEVTVEEGAVEQTEHGILLRLADALLLVPAVKKIDDVMVAKARFTPAGSALHTAFLEPREAQYVGKVDDAGWPHTTIGSFTYTKGAQTDQFTELFCAGALDGVLVVGKTSLMLRKSLLPYVLTDAAVKAGYMPPEGDSALPPTLEWDVPPELRFWKSAEGQDPRELRDQLVASGLFTEDSVQLVDGVPRRTLTKRYVAQPFPASPEVFAELVAEKRPEVELFKAYAGHATAFEEALQHDRDPVNKGELLFFYEDGVPDVTVVPKEFSRFLLGGPDTPAARKSFEAHGRPFTLFGRDGVVFVASHPPPFEVLWCEDTLPVSEEASSAIDKRALKVLRKSAEEDERFVLGVVLEPETMDSQGDIYSAEEIRKSAYRFMAHYQNTGLMHESLINEHVRIVESFVAPADVEIGGQTVKKGTWLMGVIVEDDVLWNAVKAGQLTGFSIGGSAVRTPQETAA
jgi:hypothetical protein